MTNDSGIFINYIPIEHGNGFMMHLKKARSMQLTTTSILAQEVGFVAPRTYVQEVRNICALITTSSQ